MARVTTKQSPANGSHLGFEATLWATADKLRGNLDAAEYKHVVLGLIFLKYISDAFEEKHAALQKEKDADPEDRDEYLAENVFWVPPEARWSYLQGRAKDPVIGKLLDNAMIAIERDNPSRTLCPRITLDRILTSGACPSPRAAWFSRRFRSSSLKPKARSIRLSPSAETLW